MPSILEDLSVALDIPLEDLLDFIQHGVNERKKQVIRESLDELCQKTILTCQACVAPLQLSLQKEEDEYVKKDMLEKIKVLDNHHNDIMTYLQQVRIEVEEGSLTIPAWENVEN